MDDIGKQVSIIVAIAFVVIIGLILLSGSISNDVATVTQTVTVANRTYTFPAAGANLTLPGQAGYSFVVTNRTGGAVVPASNYTITNYVSNNGQLDVVLQGRAGFYGGQSVNVTYTYEPEGYATDSGSRGVVSLIPLLFILGIVIFVLYQIKLKEYF